MEQSIFHESKHSKNISGKHKILVAKVVYSGMVEQKCEMIYTCVYLKVDLKSQRWPSFWCSKSAQFTQFSNLKGTRSYPASPQFVSVLWVSWDDDVPPSTLSCDYKYTWESPEAIPIRDPTGNLKCCDQGICLPPVCKWIGWPVTEHIHVFCVRTCVHTCVVLGAAPGLLCARPVLCCLPSAAWQATAEWVLHARAPLRALPPGVSQHAFRDQVDNRYSTKLTVRVLEVVLR